MTYSEKIKRLNDKILNLNIEKKIEKTYEPSPMNKISIEKNSFIYAQTNIDLEINMEVDQHKFENTILKVINNHPLLRVAVKEVAGETKYFQYTIEKIEIPFIDLCDDDEPTVEKFLKSLEKMYFIGFEVKAFPLFRFVLIKISKMKYRFIWWLSHLITDAISNEIILNDLIVIYKSKEIDHESINVSYNDYIDDLSSQKIKDIGIYEAYLNSYADSNKEISDYLRGIQSQNPIFHEKSISIDILSLQSTFEKGIINHLYWVYSKAISEWSGIFTLPIAGLYHGRSYLNRRSYFNLVGNFLDIVPFYVDFRETSENSSLNLVCKTLNFLDNKKVNYGKLIEEIDKKNLSGKLTEKIFNTNYPIKINAYPIIRTNSKNEFNLIDNSKLPNQTDSSNIELSIKNDGLIVELCLIASNIEQENFEELWNVLLKRVNNLIE